MDKLRVGVIVYDQSNPSEGGGHSYYDMLLKGINEFNFNPDIEIINIVFYAKNIPSLHLKKPSIYIKGEYRYSESLRNKVQKITLKKNLSTFLTRKNPVIDYILTSTINDRNKKTTDILKQHKIDLLYYLKPEFNVLNYPFIATHWDVAHKSMYAFPETSLDNHFELRENYYLYTLSKAFLILCESETGSKELKEYYSLYTNKIKVVPIFGSDVLNEHATEQAEAEVLNKYKLKKEKFFLYPAQFWSCKNHYHLVLAFNKLITESDDKELKLLLCGSDVGNMTYIKQIIESLSLTDRVIVPGFVLQKELYIFYKNAIALTMPTFLGPTNLPLIEAAHLNCPVLCSNLEGHKEILGNNALYFEPADIDSIKNAMNQILDKNARQTLIESANKYIKESGFNLNNSLNILNQVLLNTISLRKTWGFND